MHSQIVQIFFEEFVYELYQRSTSLIRKFYSLQVCVKIESPGGDAPKMFGRHFDETDLLMSRV